MQRTDAAKWFWPFMLVAAVASATIIALQTFAPAEAAPEPQFRMRVTVTARPSGVTEAVLPAAIQPYCITAKRPSILDRLAGLLPQMGPAS